MAIYVAIISVNQSINVFEILDRRLLEFRQGF